MGRGVVAFEGIDSLTPSYPMTKADSEFGRGDQTETKTEERKTARQHSRAPLFTL